MVLIRRMTGQLPQQSQTVTARDSGRDALLSDFQAYCPPFGHEIVYQIGCMPQTLFNPAGELVKIDDDRFTRLFRHLLDQKVVMPGGKFPVNLLERLAPGIKVDRFGFAAAPFLQLRDLPALSGVTPVPAGGERFRLRKDEIAGMQGQEIAPDEEVYREGRGDSSPGDGPGASCLEGDKQFLLFFLPGIEKRDGCFRTLETEDEEVMREKGSFGREAHNKLGGDVAVDLVGEFHRNLQLLQIPQSENAAYRHEAEHGGDDQEEEIVAGIYRSQAQQDRDDDIEGACSVDLYDWGI